MNDVVTNYEQLPIKEFDSHIKMYSFLFHSHVLHHHQLRYRYRLFKIDLSPLILIYMKNFVPRKNFNDGKRLTVP